MAGNPAASFNFNTFQEIKSHSSILYNERMAILFYLLDMKSIELNTKCDVGMMLEVRSILRQIYKNIRMLLRNNPTVRVTLNLDTKDEGIYIPDVAMGLVDKMIDYCDNNKYTTKRVYIIIQELNKIEMMLKDTLQYFHYFIRPDFRQKPDVDMATEAYKEFADEKTIEELKDIAGKNNAIDFESLGSKRIDFSKEVGFEDDQDDEDDEDDINDENTEA